LHAEKRIVSEHAADRVGYHTRFVKPFVNPAQNNSLLEGYWVKAVTKLSSKLVEMKRTAITLVRLLINKERSLGD